jgi:hypothetical protein
MKQPDVAIFFLRFGAVTQKALDLPSLWKGNDTLSPLEPRLTNQINNGIHLPHHLSSHDCLPWVERLAAA